jgi:hypothetical protein
VLRSRPIVTEKLRSAVIGHFVVDSVPPREEAHGEGGSPARLSKFHSERVPKDDNDNCPEEDARSYIKYIKYTKCTCAWSEEACQELATRHRAKKEVPQGLSKFHSERVPKDDKDNCAEEDARSYIKYTKCTCEWSEVAGEKGGPQPVKAIRRQTQNQALRWMDGLSRAGGNGWHATQSATTSSQS